MKYEVTKTSATIAGDTDVYQVGRGWKAVNVWHDTQRGSVRCTVCSGPLVAMLTTCPHAMAVKRFISKSKWSNAMNDIKDPTQLELPMPQPRPRVRLDADKADQPHHGHTDEDEAAQPKASYAIHSHWETYNPPPCDGYWDVTDSRTGTMDQRWWFRDLGTLTWWQDPVTGRTITHDEFMDRSLAWRGTVLPSPHIYPSPPYKMEVLMPRAKALGVTLQMMHAIYTRPQRKRIRI